MTESVFGNYALLLADIGLEMLCAQFIQTFNEIIIQVDFSPMNIYFFFLFFLLFTLPSQCIAMETEFKSWDLISDFYLRNMILSIFSK